MRKGVAVSPTTETGRSRGPGSPESAVGRGGGAVRLVDHDQPEGATRSASTASPPRILPSRRLSSRCGVVTRTLGRWSACRKRRMMGEEILGVRSPETDEGGGDDVLLRLPHLAEAGAGLLAQLFGVGQPEDGATLGQLALAVVAVEHPEGDALDRHPRLAAPGGEGHDAAPADRLLEGFEHAALHLLLERLQRFEPKAPLEVLDVRRRLGGRHAGELRREADPSHELGRRRLARDASAWGQAIPRPPAPPPRRTGTVAEQVDPVLEHERGGELRAWFPGGRAPSVF